MEKFADSQEVIGQILQLLFYYHLYLDLWTPSYFDPSFSSRVNHWLGKSSKSSVPAICVRDFLTKSKLIMRPGSTQQLSRFHLKSRSLNSFHKWCRNSWTDGRKCITNFDSAEKSLTFFTAHNGLRSFTFFDDNPLTKWPPPKNDLLSVNFL